MGLVRDWLQNREDILRQKHKEQVDDALRKLSLVPSGKVFADFAAEKKMFIRVVGDLPSSTLAVYRPSRFVDLAHGFTPETLAHELHHAMQDAAGLTLHRKTDARANIIMTRFEEADAFARETQVAWELTVHGVDPAAWRRIRRAAPFQVSAFEKAFKHDSQADRNGWALRAAFDAFFANRVLKNDYDRYALRQSGEQIERIRQGQRANTLQDKKRPDGAPAFLSAEHLREFGALADGTNYLSGADTTAAFYVAAFSGGNRSRLEKITREYETMYKKPVPARNAP